MNKIDVLARINHQMSEVLQKESELAGDANDTSVGFEAMRKNYTEGRAYWNEGAPLMSGVCDVAFDGPYGPIGVRLYYPTDESLEGYVASQALTPGIVYIHGGGFVLGNLDTHDRICRYVARNTSAIVVAVDYRLSPEAKFPSAVEESAAVLRYLHECGAAYGIDGNRLAAAGDSGGAHLSLAATLHLRQEYGDSSFMKCLLLYYGWFGLSDSSSMRLLGGPWDGLTESDWLWYLSLYAHESDDLTKERYANLFLNDLMHDMPACYIAAAEFDPLRDDSATLAAMLEQGGIPFKYEVFEGVIHAFLHYTKILDAATDALEHGATFYRQQLGLPAEGARVRFVDKAIC